MSTDSAMRLPKEERIPRHSRDDDGVDGVDRSTRSSYHDYVGVRVDRIGRVDIDEIGRHARRGSVVRQGHEDTVVSARFGLPTSFVEKKRQVVCRRCSVYQEIAVNPTLVPTRDRADDWCRRNRRGDDPAVNDVRCSGDLSGRCNPQEEKRYEDPDGENPSRSSTSQEKSPWKYFR